MVTSDITVSVVVPVYNAEKYLEECLDSLLAQTLQNIELILVDDGSTDCSGKICDEYREKHPSAITVIHKKNGGATAARLSGINAAKGEYVGFVDSDDVVSPYLYETLFFAAVQLNLDCAKVQTGDFSSAERPERAATADEFTVYTGSELRKRYINLFISGYNEAVSMCDKVIRRDLLLTGNGEQDVQNTLEDYYVNMNMALKYFRYGELNRTFYFVRYRRGSLSRCSTDCDFAVLLQVQRRKEDIMNQLGCTEEERAQADRWFADYAVSLVTKLYEYSDKRDRRKKALKILNDARLVECCRRVRNNQQVGRRIWYKVIGNSKPHLALALILIRYEIRKWYGKLKYHR